MSKFYFNSLGGGRVFADTVQAISKLAQREADRFNVAVQVHTAATGAKSHRKMSMAKNPAKRKAKAGSGSGGLMCYIEGRKAGKGGGRVACPYTGQDAVNWRKGFAKGKSER